MNISNHLKNTLKSAIGQWPSLHKAAGISLEFLQNKHGPCPLCGGKDRFRYDNKEGRGTYYCNQCGAGDGFELLKKFTSSTITEALRFLEEYLSRNEGNSEKPWHVMTYTRPIIEKALSSRTTDLQKTVAHIQAYAIPASPTHPYLLQKKIPAEGLRQYKDALIVEMYDEVHELVSLQLINPDSSKRFLKGTHKKGAYSIVGKHHPHDPIIIAEGFATAMSIHLSIELPVFISIDCNNIEHALKTILRCHKHNGQIILAADNDSGGQGFVCVKIAITNLGLNQARIIMPNRVGYDWNDIYCEEGPEAISAAFREVLP